MLISLTQDCYLAMRKIREEIMKTKRQMGAPDKTTFSEIVFMFIKKYEQTMTKDGVRANLDSSHLLISSRNDLNDDR